MKFDYNKLIEEFRNTKDYGIIDKIFSARKLDKKNLLDIETYKSSKPNSNFSKYFEKVSKKILKESIQIKKEIGGAISETENGGYIENKKIIGKVNMIDNWVNVKFITSLPKDIKNIVFYHTHIPPDQIYPSKDDIKLIDTNQILMDAFYEKRVSVYNVIVAEEIMWYQSTLDKQISKSKTFK